MTASELQQLLDRVRDGNIDPVTASNRILEALRAAPLEDLGFARIDHHREIRRGFPEVVLGVGKTPAQIAAIAEKIVARGHALLVTRAHPEAFDAVRVIVPGAVYHAEARAITLPQGEISRGRGTVLIVSAGTSDLPVAEEAAVTAELMGNTIERIYDVGVAGLHRLLAEHSRLTSARVIIVAAPVVAVPTSIGYGASFGGLTALLAMLNSCAIGVSVVNIDNGFGAAAIASSINHLD